MIHNNQQEIKIKITEDKETVEKRITTTNQAEVKRMNQQNQTMPCWENLFCYNDNKIYVYKS